MRIAIEATWAQGQVTGVGFYIRQLLEQYSKIAPEHEYFLLHFNPEWTGPDFGPAFKTVPYRLGSAVTSIGLRLGHVLKTLEPDLFHVTNATGVPPRPPVPVVTTVHDLYRYYPEAATSWTSNLVFRFLFRWSRHYSSRFIADSDVTALDMERITGIAADRITTIHLAPVRDPHADAGRGNDLPIDDGERHILCLGALEARKGQVFLTEVYAAMLAENPDLPDLVLAGPDRGVLAQIQARLTNEQLRRKVRIVNYVDDALKERLFRQSLMFVMPSTFEGFGLPLLEAMDRRIPTVASDIPIFREIASEGAFLIPGRDVTLWKESLATLLQDAARRKRLADSGQQHAARFSWETCARETLACYRSVIHPDFSEV